MQIHKQGMRWRCDEAARTPGVKIRTLKVMDVRRRNSDLVEQYWSGGVGTVATPLYPTVADGVGEPSEMILWVRITAIGPAYLIQCNFFLHKMKVYENGTEGSCQGRRVGPHISVLPTEPASPQHPHFWSHMALQVHCSLVGRGFAASPSLPIVPLNRLRPCCRQTGSWDDLRVNLSDFRKGWGLELGCGLRPRFERVPCCARLGGDVAEVESCKSQLSGGEASFMARMAGILEILRSLALGGDCNSSCPASARQWRAFPAALLCSCAVVTPGMASPVAAVEPVPASDFLVALLTLGGALGILQFFDELAKRNLLEKVTNAPPSTITMALSYHLH